MLPKIGLVTGEFPPMEGGVGAFTRELAKALSAAGFRIHIITDRRARPSDVGRHWRDLGDPVEISYATLHPIVRKWRWPAVATVADVALRYELDVVNIQYQAAAYDMRSPSVNLVPLRLKGICKNVVTFHDLREPYLFPKAGRLRKYFVNIMARQAHGIIATNAFDYERLRATLPTGSPLAQIPIGSNITAVEDPRQAKEARKQLGVDSADCLLGYFGFLNESKGANFLLHALARTGENTYLVFIGGQSGSSDSENNLAYGSVIRELAESLGIAHRVRWTGFVSESEVSACLNASDIVVMPYRDGASLRRGTLMAALSHGRPLITTHPSHPTPELRHCRNVYLVPADDAVALAEAIEFLAHDSVLRESLGRKARELAESFTWDKIAANTGQFFTALLADSRSSSTSTA